MSYARREFYFAESLVGHLAERGVACWLDVQQLQPGTDWEAAILRAMDACAALVLVASRASIESPYVSREWRAAIAAGKPVYIVMSSRVDLPAELANVPVYDLRTHFASAANQLAADIQRGAEPGRRIHAASSRWPHLPVPVSLVSVGLGAGCVLIGTSAAPLFGALATHDLEFMLRIANPKLLTIAVLQAMPSLLLTAMYAWLLVKFLRRTRTRFGEIRFALFAVPLLAWYSYTAWGRLADYLERDGSFITNAPNPPFVELMLLLILGTWIVGWVAGYLMGQSEDMLRWLITGEAPDSLRDRFDRGRPSLTPVVARDASPTFALEYTDGDSRVGADIVSAIPDRLLIRDKSRGDADYHIVVLSNCTPESTLSRLFSSPGARLVCVIASNLKLPVHSDIIHRFQWVDYRRRSAETLQAMVSTLRSQAPGGAPQGWTFVPESLLKPVLPSRVFRFSATLKLLVALNVAAALALVAGQSGGLKLDGRTLLALAVALTFAAMTVGLLARLVTFRILVIGLAVAWFGMVFSNVAESFARFFPGYAIGSINLMALLYVFLPVAVFVWLAPDLQRWLPTVSQWLPRGTTPLVAIDGVGEFALWAFLIVTLVVPLMGTT